MNINHFGNSDGLISPEADFYYINSPKKDYSSLNEFRNAFVNKQIMNDTEIINFPISPHTFCEIRSGIIGGIENLITPVFEEEIISASILIDEWNLKCIIAELTNIYIGYLWETSA